MIVCMYYAPNGGFTAKDAAFYHDKVGQQHNSLQFQLIVYAITKITRRYTTAPLYEFAAKQPQKEHKLEVEKFSVKIKCKSGWA